MEVFKVRSSIPPPEHSSEQHERIDISLVCHKQCITALSRRANVLWFPELI
jgi:hypothetical protein